MSTAGVKFSISMEFSDEDLVRIHASKSNVIIAKPTKEVTGPNVAWVVYKPLTKNSVTWEENYGIYASNAELQNGALLEQMSNTPYPANAGTLYTMMPAGNISKPTSGGSPNAYTIKNDYDNPPKRYLTFGLYQEADVNGDKVSSAVSAVVVLKESTAKMTPFTTVYLWIQSEVSSNTVVSTVTSPMTQVTLGGDVVSARLKYDSNSGKFLPALSEKVLSVGRGLEHILPKS